HGATISKPITTPNPENTHQGGSTIAGPTTLREEPSYSGRVVEGVGVVLDESGWSVGGDVMTPVVVAALVAPVLLVVAALVVAAAALMMAAVLVVVVMMMMMVSRSASTWRLSADVPSLELTLGAQPVVAGGETAAAPVSWIGAGLRCRPAPGRPR